MSPTYLIVGLLIVIAMVVVGGRRGEPAWAIGGQVAGFVTLAIGLWWAASIGSRALWAAIVVGVGIAVWAQTEFLWWRVRARR